LEKGNAAVPSVVIIIIAGRQRIAESMELYERGESLGISIQVETSRYLVVGRSFILKIKHDVRRRGVRSGRRRGGEGGKRTCHDKDEV